MKNVLLFLRTNGAVGCAVFVLFLLFGISSTYAANTYVPLVGIPGLPTNANTTLPEFINKVYFFTISLGALFGVLKIAFAGVKYSMTDVLSSKQSAREDIKGVLLGLAILLLPALVLQTINPQLIELNFLQNVPPIQLDKSMMDGLSQSAIDNQNDANQSGGGNGGGAGNNGGAVGGPSKGDIRKSDECKYLTKAEKMVCTKKCTGRNSDVTDIPDNTPGVTGTGKIRCTFDMFQDANGNYVRAQSAGGNSAPAQAGNSNVAPQAAPVTQRKTSKCDYTDAASKDSCIRNCSGANSATKDIPNVHPVYGNTPIVGVKGTIECSYDSLVGNIPN